MLPARSRPAASTPWRERLAVFSAHKWWSGVGAIGTIAALVIAILQLGQSPTPPAPSSSAASPQPNPPSPSGGEPGRPPGRYPGALLVTLNSANSEPNFDFMYPRSQAAKADRYRPGPVGNVVDLNSAALTDGAYAVQSLSLTVSLESRLDRKITVYDIKPVAVPGPIVDGPLIALGNQGSTADEMIFDLDAAAPTALRADARPYFRSHSIILGRGEKNTVVMAFFALTASYSFRVAVSFEVDGRRYTEMLDRAGRPFLLTPDLCPVRFTSSPFYDKHWQQAKAALEPRMPSRVLFRNTMTTAVDVPPPVYGQYPECQ
ncbi:hypothetical protein AB0J83_41710 [Actinoplanes sp. NPDC049596]|uniref:hypothetical protein n=1 Tax=unclassified Actinoplanes TaxID=2626549 RepID=UPI00344269AD